MESLRDNFKYNVQKYCDFKEYFGIIIITFFQIIPEGDTTTVHFPLSTVHWSEAINTNLSGKLTETDKHIL